VSIQARVSAARQRLREAGVSVAESDIDARLLAQHILEWSTERFLAHSAEAEPDGFAARYETLVARRAAREPVAYITGHREFWGLEFETTPAVLIPRPSTELIVEAALDLFPDRHAPLALADICTGCGCVAIAVAHERPDASVLATDISTAALQVARRNAIRHDVASRVSFQPGDLLDGIDQQFDAIFANPPYVFDNAGPALQPEVRDFEPSVALFGGADGLTLIARLVEQAPARLKAGGYFIFEFGYGHDVEIEDLLANSAQLTLVDVRKDLQGIARNAVAKRV
jgi:release factor glutamine methyltransferase